MSRSVPPTHFRGQRVLLMGLGRHGGGIATAKWLVKQGAQLLVNDKQTKTQLSDSIKQLRGLNYRGHFGAQTLADVRWADRIVVNPGMHPNIPELRLASKQRKLIDNEASIFVRQFPGTLIGVTGTRGKTTTTLLLGAMITAAHRDTIISGNVRQVPMLSYLPKAKSTTSAVLELSSYQLERLPVVGKPFHIAVMTNLKVDHISRHGTMKNYANTKYNLFRGQTNKDFAVLNYDDPYCRAAAKVSASLNIWFSLKLPNKVNGFTIGNGWVIEQLDGTTHKIMSLSHWTLPGEHNLMNLLAATAAASAYGVSPKVVINAVKKFHGVPYRQEKIRSYKGHDMINDTAATSPDGMLAALAVYSQAVCICGGTDKQLDFHALAKDIVRRNVKTVFLPGTATVQLQALLKKFKYRQPIISVHSMKSAVTTALVLATPRQPIILSPGCASFGLFLHEFDRGDQFNQVVNNLS